jgi:hypothetical protein
MACVSARPAKIASSSALNFRCYWIVWKYCGLTFAMSAMGSDPMGGSAPHY